MCLIHTHAHTHNTHTWVLPRYTCLKLYRSTATGGGEFCSYLFIHLFLSLLRQNCCRSLEEIFSLSLKQPGFTFLVLKEIIFKDAQLLSNRCDIPGWWVFIPVNSCELAFQNPSTNFFSMRIQHLTEKQRLSANQGENPEFLLRGGIQKEW